MTREDYQNLLEYLSLSKLIDKEQKIISENEDRITVIQKNKDKKEENLLCTQTELKDLTLKTSQFESKLEENLSQIEKLKSDQKLLTNEQQIVANEKQLEDLENQNIQLEEELFNLLEKTDHAESDILDYQKFISGVSETIQEISNEVQNIVKTSNGKIQQLEKRRKNLEENISSELNRFFQIALKKHGPLKFSAFIKKIHCSECMVQLEREIIEKVEYMKGVSLCSSCKRLLFPENSRKVLAP